MVFIKLLPAACPWCVQIYMGIAVGNSPWPIGVTQVGLHERAAREKISFKGTQGQVGAGAGPDPPALCVVCDP
jgi:hypothetical protein